MKIKNAFLFVLLFTCCTYAQSRSLFDLYKIPRISFHQLNLRGDNLLNLNNSSYGDDGSESSTLSAYLDLSHIYFFQSPLSKNKISTYLSFGYCKTKEVSNLDPAKINENIRSSLTIISSNSWYTSGEKEMFLFVNPQVYICNDRNTIAKNDDKHRGVSAEFGAGYGRIVNVKNVVQARIIADELKCNLSDEALLKLAGIIERRENEEYYAKYKDDYETYFYKDIAEITSHPEFESKIRQILYSSLYKTSMRETGWEAKFGMRYTYYETNYFNSNSIWSYTNHNLTKGADLFTSFSYALPVDYNKQLSASAEYSINLNDEWMRMPQLSLSTFFSIDHSYLWSSQLSAFYNIGFAKGRDNLGHYGIVIQSSYTLFNKLAATAQMQYAFLEFHNYMLPVWNPVLLEIPRTKELHFSIGFAYHIL